MESIASKLKTRRESLNISLEQISKDTHISIHHLNSLESDRYDDLPGGMYNRAILRAYCDEIGLNKDEILQCYDDKVAPPQENPVINSSSQPLSLNIKTHTAVFWSIVFLLGIGLLLNRGLFVSALSPYFPTDRGIASSELASGHRAPAKTVSADTTAQTAFGADDANLPALRLEIVGKEECWISVDSDNSGAVSKLMSPGDVELFTAAGTISLIVGNAGGISLRINDQSAKTLGQSGQVVHLTIDKDALPTLIDHSMAIGKVND